MPTNDQSLDKLIAAHKKRKDEPLVLAVRFFPAKGKKHIHLLEVLGGFGGKSVARDRRLFSIAFGSTPDLPLDEGVELRLLLTNPREFEVALREGWPSVEPIRRSKRDRSGRVLATTALGRRLWEEV